MSRQFTNAQELSDWLDSQGNSSDSDIDYSFVAKVSSRDNFSSATEFGVGIIQAEDTGDLYRCDGANFYLIYTPNIIGNELTMISVGDSIFQTSANGNVFGYGNPPGTNGTAQKNSICAWAAAKSKGNIVLLNGAAVAGWKTSDVDAVWDINVAAKKPNIVVLEIGFNDIFGTTSDSEAITAVANLKTWVPNRIKDVKGWGGLVILTTLIPAPTTWPSYSAAKRLLERNYNIWLRRNATSLGVKLFDMESIVIDPASTGGEALTTYSTDKVHPNTLYRRLIGEALFTNILSQLVPNQDILHKSRYAGDLRFPDPLFYTTGGTVTGLAGGSALPQYWQPWAAAGETTAIIEAASDSIGNWIKVTTVAAGALVTSTNAPGVAANFGTQFLAGGVPVAGDRFRLRLEIEVVSSETFSGVQAVLQLGAVSGNAYAVAAVTPLGSNYTTADPNASSGIWTSDEIVIPAGETINAAFLWIQGFHAAAGTNVWRFRRVVVEKLN